MIQQLKQPSIDEVTHLYDNLVYLADVFSQHQWGKRITEKDAEFVASFHKALLDVSNQAFNAHHMKGDGA